MFKTIATTLALGMATTGMAQAQDYNFDVFVGHSVENNLLWDNIQYDTSSGSALGFRA